MRNWVPIALLSVLLLGASCPQPVPPGRYDCDAQPELRSGVVESADPVTDCYVGILLERDTTALELAAAVPAGANPLPLINGFVVRGVDRRGARSVASSVSSASNSEVALFECSKVSVPDTPVSPTRAVWGLDRIDQQDLPLDGKYEPAGTGSGSRVGINDTGEPFQRAGWQKVGPCMSAVGSCKDDHDHGSHVGGTAAHERYGVAPGAEIAWCKSLINGNGSSGDVIECIQLITDWCGGQGPCIGNMSLGGTPDDPIDRAVCASRDAGVLWVVAAGNDSGDACGHSPARGSGAITVGATDDRDRAAGFSNGGSCVDIHAPGVAITSVGKRGEQLTWDGTSMASPHVAGVAAICAESLGTSDPAAIRGCVLDQATLGRLGGLRPDTVNALAYTPK